ncbi:MAG: MBL fold metallo-hydrolase [Deltaproteobacteria bacterium]|nr:MBL fold metallo-hydrolase [Deltaproteobacteria bacterium]MBN2672210.1 MBL fold metallo-hydrolase [Deltaproteobacteria bacterium]
MTTSQTSLFSDSSLDFFAISLQSGSNGNCIFVSAGNTRLLFDAGISGIQAQQRLATHELDINDVDALLISHDHSDHTRCAGVFHRKFGCALYMTRMTHAVLQQTNRLGKIGAVHFFTSGRAIRINDVQVQTVPTPHDGVDGVAFVVTYRNKKLGIFTDLGHPFKKLESIICTLDAVFLESNYDVEMLRTGPYPYPLKKRISDPAGHISNEESAQLLKSAFAHNLQWAVLSHLSGENNTPKIALATHRKIVGKDNPIFVADRHSVSDRFVIS